jgi:hypothetical protein
MRTIYAWQCPKCGKQYVNGEEPTYCERPLFLKTPGHPLADPESGLLETRCGAPILPLSPRVVVEAPSGASGAPRRGTELTNEAIMTDEDVHPDGPIMETIMRVINSRNWRHARYTRFPMVELSLNCAHSTVRMVATAREKEHQVIVCAWMAPKVPPERRVAVAEFFSRLNITYYVGSFDVDLDDGGVRFRVGLDVEGGELTDQMALNLFVMTAYVADLHHERVMRVIYGGADPKAAMDTPAA